MLPNEQPLNSVLHELEHAAQAKTGRFADEIADETLEGWDVASRTPLTGYEEAAEGAAHDRMRVAAELLDFDEVEAAEFVADIKHGSAQFAPAQQLEDGRFSRRVVSDKGQEVTVIYDPENPQRLTFDDMPDGELEPEFFKDIIAYVDKSSPGGMVLSVTPRDTKQLEALRRAGFTAPKQDEAARVMAELSGDMPTLEAFVAPADEVTRAEAQLRDLMISDIDYDRIVDFFAERGYDPEFGEYMRDLALVLKGKYEDLNAMRRAIGIGHPELLGKGQGAAGYAKQTEQEFATVWEQIRGVLADATEGRRIEISPPPRRTARNEVIAAEGGKTLDEGLMAANDMPRNEGISFGFGKSPKPEQSKKRKFFNIFERLNAEVNTQTDIGFAHAAKVEEDLVALKKGELENRLVGYYGRKLDDVTNPVTGKTRPAEAARGYAVHTVTRKGVTERFEIPLEAQKWMEDIQKTVINDENLKWLARQADRLTNTWKRMATSWRPAFHGRNLVSNYWLAWSQDADYAKPEYWIDAWKVMNKVDGSYKVGDETLTAVEVLDDARFYGVTRENFGPSEVMHYLNRMVSEEQASTARKAFFAGERGLDSQVLRGMSPSIGGNDLGTAIEDGSRLAVYIGARNKGMTKEAAADAADRALFNYSPEALSAAEREVFKRIVPFYTWIRRAVPAVFETTLKRPGKVLGMKRVSDAAFAAYDDVDRELLPDYMQNSAAFPTPFKNAEGNRYLLNPGLPISELARVNPDDFKDSGLIGGIIKAATRPVMESSNPIAKTGAELVYNKELFFDREISRFPGDTRKMPGGAQLTEKILGGSEPWESLKDTMGWVTRETRNGEPYLAGNAETWYVMEQLSPFFNDLNKFVDPSTTNAQRIGLATGAGKTYEYDEEKLAATKEYLTNEKLQDEVRRLKDIGVIPEASEKSEPKRKAR